MPERHEHIAQFEHNSSLSQAPLFHDPDNLDWYIALCYFAAVHLIDAHLAGNDDHPVCEEERESRFLSYCELNGQHANLFNSFVTLRMQARKTLYMCIPLGSKRMDSVRNAFHELEQRLA